MRENTQKFQHKANAKINHQQSQRQLLSTSGGNIHSIVLGALTGERAHTRQRYLRNENSAAQSVFRGPSTQAAENSSFARLTRQTTDKKKKSEKKKLSEVVIYYVTL